MHFDSEDSPLPIQEETPGGCLGLLFALAIAIGLLIGLLLPVMP